MNNEIPNIKSGHLLLAEPFMHDPYFHRGVVLLCEHHDEGSLGFIMNKPLEMTLNELVRDFPEISAKVYYGGPVGNDTLHYIHNVGELLPDSVEVASGIYWGGDYEKLKFLIESNLIQPHNIRFFVGYSGWSAGQLKDELKIGSWVSAHVNKQNVFEDNATDLWKLIMQEKGDVYSVIAELPDTAILN